MPFSAGPNIAARPNLVFEYDTGDVQNSYKGEPTTNISNGLTGHGGSWTLQSQTYNGAPVYRNVVTSPSTFNNFGFRSNVQVNLNQSGPKYLTISFYANVLVSPGALYGYITVAFTDSSQEAYGWSYIPSNWATTNIGQWQFVKATVALNPAKIPQTTVNWYVYRDNATEGTVDFAAIQLEQKDHPTPFVAMGTSRSNTQGLLDVSGQNTTIDLSNMAYTSTAGLSFNGSTTEMHPTTVLSYLSSSAMECVFSTATVSGLKTIFGYSQNGGYSQPTIGSMYLDSNTLNASVITAAQVYRTATAAATISANTFYHVVLNKDTSGGNLQLYVNGTLSGTQTFDVATYGQWSSPGNYIGSNLLDIGKSTNTNVGQGWSTSALSGSIPIARIYNITLSATQVLQNYNQLKRRFNLI